MKCGKPVRYEEQEYCRDCAHAHHDYDRGLSMWLHQPPVNQSIYQFKYHNRRVFADYYASEIAGTYQEQLRQWKPEVIVPVPLHPGRKRQRGYNQAQILAEALGTYLKVPVSTKMVRRIRATDPQKNLGYRDRKRNLEQAFAAGQMMRVPETVLVVDDIYTTGNTIDHVAKVLKERGVQKVYFLTISIGQGY